MSCDVMMQIEQLLALNTLLLQQADTGEWDAFVEEVEAYSQRMRTLCEIDLIQLTEQHKTQVAVQLAHLLDNDALLMRAVQGRLATIRTELSTMRKSSASAKAYTAV
jgi:hypothetical protein